MKEKARDKKDMLEHGYIPYEVLKNMKEPSEKGSIFLGFLGSLAGAAVIMLISIFLWACDLRTEWDIGQGYFLIPLIGWNLVGLGYRLFHGRRSVPVAFSIVGAVIVLSNLVWQICLVFFLTFDKIGLPGLSSGSLWGNLMVMIPKWWQRSGNAKWMLSLCCWLFCLIGFSIGYDPLIRYADWEKTPLRTAKVMVGHVYYNLFPKRLPQGKIPERFCVGKHIVIEGERLRVLSRLKKEQTFTIRDIAGVVMGSSRGYNVIYGWNYQILAKFAGSMKNAELMIKYLIDHQIAMTGIQPGWRPVWSEEPVANIKVSLPEKFTLRIEPRFRKVCVVGKICTMFIACLSLFCAVFLLIVGELGISFVFMGLCLILVGEAFLFIGVSNQRGQVDGDRLWIITKWGRTHVFSIRDIVSTSRTGGYLVLYGRDWKRLDKLDLRLEGISMLEQYINREGKQWG